ncbi:TonB family protein [Emcibacter sp.]|uniref:energy transducer TonB n=1 Tax=Emcibacter sp. TaxID=1979954 RepID=UPI002AA90324|nr:TonB family protein [Emcibacter sp.]
MIARAGTSFSLAMVVTFGLFFFMQQMTRTPDIQIPDVKFEPVIMGDIRRPKPIDNTIKRPERPEPVEIVDREELPLDPLPGNDVKINTGFDRGPVTPELPHKNTVGFSDGEVYAITAVAPEYPVSAARQGLSGYVVVGFTVDKRGAVTDAYVIESSSRLFEKSALRAITKFKYKPKVVDGSPVAQGNLLYKFTYELQDNA